MKSCHESVSVSCPTQRSQTPVQGAGVVAKTHLHHLHHYHGMRHRSVEGSGRAVGQTVGKLENKYNI